MNERSRSNQRMLGLGLGLTLALLLLALLLSVLRLRTNPARATALPVYGQVADFLLTNSMARRFRSPTSSAGFGSRTLSSRAAPGRARA